MSSLIQTGETIRGLTNVSPFVTERLANLSSKKVERFYFPDAEKQFFDKLGIVVDVDSTFIYDTKDPILATFFLDSNRNRRQDANEASFNLKLYVSKDGNKIKEIYEDSVPKADELLLFVEDNTGDNSNQVVRGRVGSQVREQFTNAQLASPKVLERINANVELTKDFLLQLLDKGYAVEETSFGGKALSFLAEVMTIITAPAYALGWVLDKIGDGVNVLQIPEKIWDTQNEDYVLKKENILDAYKIDASGLDNLQKLLDANSKTFIYTSLVPELTTTYITKGLAVVKELIDGYNAYVDNVVDRAVDSLAVAVDQENLKEQLAFIAGLWNGLIDFIASTLKFVAGLLQLNYNLYSNAQNILETADTFLDTLSNIQWQDVLDGFAQVKQDIITFIKDEDNGEIDVVRVAYAVGFGLAFVATLFIPFSALGKIANLQKIDYINALIKGINGIAGNATTHLQQATRKGVEGSLKLLNDLLAIFAKGKESITKFFRELIDTIVEWFLRNKNKFEKADDFENLITKSNYRVFSKRYPKLIARGRSIVKKSFDKKFIKESKKFDTSTYRKEAKEAFEKYLAKSKPQTKISESTYLKFHKTLSLNKIAGEIAEELIIKYLKGKIEPRKSIRIPPDKRRFPDNFLSNTLKEVKSGRVTLKYKNQIDKDIKILSDKLKFNGQLIKKIEWHTMGGVDEAVLKYVKNEMQNNGLPLSKFQIIVY